MDVRLRIWQTVSRPRMLQKHLIKLFIIKGKRQQVMYEMALHYTLQFYHLSSFIGPGKWRCTVRQESCWLGYLDMVGGSYAGAKVSTAMSLAPKGEETALCDQGVGNSSGQEGSREEELDLRPSDTDQLRIPEWKGRTLQILKLSDLKIFILLLNYYKSQPYY